MLAIVAIRLHLRVLVEVPIILHRHTRVVNIEEMGIVKLGVNRY